MSAGPSELRGRRDRLRWWLATRRVRVREWLLEDGATRGLGGPPNNWQMSPKVRGAWGVPGGAIYRGVFLNDAGEIGISIDYPGEGERWAAMVPANAFRAIALWYVWRFAYGEWFGMRRRLYYRWLHWHVGKMRRTGPRPPRQGVGE